MTTQAAKFPPVLLWTAGVALILFCAAGIAAFMGWIPNSSGSTSDSVVTDRHTANMPKSDAAPVHMASNVAAKTRCAGCGVIESTREIETRAEATGLGAVGGAVVGGLLGNQTGGGRGKDVMTVVGAVGGGLAGNEIEKRVKSTKSYAITVRFDDGSTRVINETTAPTWRTGDKVKVVDGVIHSNG